MTHQSDQIGRTGVAKRVACQDLQGLGSAPDIGRHYVEQDVGYDTPVEVEGDLSDEQHDEHGVDVLVRQEHPDAEEDGAEDDSKGTNQWVSPGILGLQIGGEDHAQRNPHNTRDHRHDPEDQLDVLLVNLSVLRLLGKQAGPDEVWPKPGESSEAKSDAGEAHRREDEALVLGQTDNVLLK